MTYQHPMADRFQSFTNEIKQKNEKLTATVEAFSLKCVAELELLTQQLHTASAKLLVAETYGETDIAKTLEATIATIKGKIAETKEKSRRYEGVTPGQILQEDFPMLQEYALASKNERQSILQKIAAKQQANADEIERIKKESFLLSSERDTYKCDFEITCIYSIAEYIPGGDQINPYSPDRMDYTRKDQVSQLLFGEGR